MKNRNQPRHRLVLIQVVASLIIGATAFSGSSRVVFAQTAGPSWSYTGSLNTGRVRHTATLLSNGKMLVVGGSIWDGGHYSGLASAELYDPATGAWSITGSLNVSRSGHTATLLPNGKVLVAGDGNNTAEVYDPLTEAWSLTGSLPTSWFVEAATLLQNGKVLAVGGEYSNPITKTAELYDPATGTWSASGSFETGSHLVQSATLLPNGNVLVLLGGDEDDFVWDPATSVLYDPNTRSWSRTAGLNTSRIDHTTTLLPDGDILVTGGWGFPCVANYCYSTVTNTAELYDPLNGRWRYTGNLSRRSEHSATLLPNGKVLIAGGDNYAYDSSYTKATLKSAEVYDSTTATWSATADLNAPRYFHTATLLSNGKVLVVGGFDGSGSGPLRSAELYDAGAISTPNAIDDAQFFVRQHYLDFLNREPDSTGLAFWTNEIASCGMDQQCIDTKRINVSAAYFLSIEFQQTGYLVYRMYQAAYGNLPNAPVPIRFNEFVPDAQEISHGVVVGQTGWETALENNKQAFSDEFVTRSRFMSAYSQSMTPAEFVNKLNANGGNPLTPTERDHLVSDLEAGAKTRAEVLRAAAENEQLAKQEFNRAFVLMQYFGYLRRNPNDAPEPTLDFQGYNFWLNKLNQFNGDFAGAEMVKAFITSGEYRGRFGP